MARDGLKLMLCLQKSPKYHGCLLHDEICLIFSSKLYRIIFCVLSAVNYAQKWPEIAISAWHSPFKAQGIIDQYLGIGEPLRVWNPDPGFLWTKKSWNPYPALGNNLNFITLFTTKDKMQVVLHVLKTFIGNYCNREETSLRHIPMVAKRHLKSRFALFQTSLILFFISFICQMLAKLSGFNPKGPYVSLEKEKQNFFLVLTYSTKGAHEISMSRSRNNG